MPWGFVASAAIGAIASNSAARTQANAANRATDTQRQMFETQRGDQAPYRAAGSTALNSIMSGFGTPTLDENGNPVTDSSGIPGGYFNHQFNSADLNSQLAPNFEFMRNIGSGAVSNMANAMGGLGGNSLAEISKWNTGFAQNAYQQAFENYQNQRAGIFGRLQGIANLGQAAASNQATGGSAYAGNIAGSQMGAGNALAAGQMGVGNALGGAAGWYALNNMYNPASRGVAGSDYPNAIAELGGGGP